MAISELFAISKAYPFISIIVAVIFFFVGLKITAKLFKWLLWILAAVAVIIALVMLFS